VHRVFRYRTPVWQADLDAFGELRCCTLLKLLQETATRASTDAGFDPVYYRRSATMWLVRRTTLTVLAPMRYGDELEVETAIADFRRVRSRRDYEIRVGTDMVARAQTDWVYVDAARGQPRRIPSEMQRAFASDDAAPLPRPPFPEPDPPATAAVSERRVELHELDALRHVNNANYVNYVEQAVHDAITRAGWPLTRLLASGGRLRLASHDLEYFDAAVGDDRLEVVTWPDALTEATVAWHTIVRRAQQLRPLLRAASTYRWITMPGGTAAPLPDDLRLALMSR
jgi:acyl-CoA thioester hydrolase